MDELNVSYFVPKLWLYVMIWLPRTTDNSTHFAQSLEIRGIESRLYIIHFLEVITKYRDKISSLEKDIKEIEHQEKEEREMRATENQMNKAKRILEESGGSEQAKRAWFQTHKERLQERGTTFYTKLPSSAIFISRG